MRWIRFEDRLPEKGMPVLVWYGDGLPGNGVAFIHENGKWKGRRPKGKKTPTHWMSLPNPPGAAYEDASLQDIKGEIIDNRLALNIEDQKEAVAVLMQHYIDGGSAAINGERYFVVDMKNEVAVDGHMASVFYLKKASE
jgi:hypothetical protein